VPATTDFVGKELKSSTLNFLFGLAGVAGATAGRESGAVL